MGKEFVIDNLEDMCALMCDNRMPNIKPDQIKHLANGDWQNGNVTSTISYSDRTETIIEADKGGQNETDN